MTSKLFSDAWGEHARDMWNNSPSIQKGLADPDSFTYVMEMGVSDRGVRSELVIERGVCTSWGAPSRSEEELDFRIWAPLSVWQALAAGTLNPLVALSSGDVDFRKGPVSEALRNATAFEGVMVGLGEIPTDWDV